MTNRGRSRARAARAAPARPWLLLSAALVLVLCACHGADAWFWDTLVPKNQKAKSESNKCVSKTGWAKFELHGQPPKQVEGLTYCSRWKEHTCCDAEQTNRARSLYSSMDYRTTEKTCREVWQLLQCSVCSPSVGVVNRTRSQPVAGDEGDDDFSQRVPITKGFCEKVYSRCESSQFAGDDDYAIRGCSPTKDVVCSELRHWGLTPVEFCELAGFRVCQSAVGDDDDDNDDDDDVLDLGMAAEAEGEGYCYDGEGSSEAGLEAERERERRHLQKQRGYGNSRKRMGMKGRGFFRRVFGKKHERRARRACAAAGLALLITGVLVHRRRRRQRREHRYVDRSSVIRKMQEDLDNSVVAKKAK